jgi:hypothetical protein
VPNPNPPLRPRFVREEPRADEPEVPVELATESPEEPRDELAAARALIRKLKAVAKAERAARRQAQGAALAASERIEMLEASLEDAWAQVRESDYQLALARRPRWRRVLRRPPVP